MNIAIFANEVIFPVLLFFVFYYFLIIRPETQALEFDTVGVNMQSLNSVEAVNVDIIDNIYDAIARDNHWQSELDSVSTRKELIDKIIAIAANNGYSLASQDVESSIQQHTQASQTNYVCLPIGCWRVS